jgi:general secretion pathway protein D
VLAQIDVDTGITRLVGLDNAGAREIAEALGELAPEGTTVVAVDSSNAIAIRGDAATVAQLSQIAAELDRRAASGSEIRVVYLQHADAEQLLPVIQELLGQAPTPPSTRQRLRRGRTSNNAQRHDADGRAQESAPAPAASSSNGNAAIASRNAVVTRFEGANAIVIAATPDVQRAIGEVIRQLDVRVSRCWSRRSSSRFPTPPPSSSAFQLFLSGLEGSEHPVRRDLLFGDHAEPRRHRRRGSRPASLADPRPPSPPAAARPPRPPAARDRADRRAAAQLARINGGLFGGAFQAGNAIFGTIINAVRSDNQSNILSTPSLMTLDNQEARILVGQEIPITTGEALSENFDNTFRTVQRQNVGITLEVRPQINAGGTIKLDLRRKSARSPGRSPATPTI